MSKERVQLILKNVYKLNYWFAKEMFEQEEAMEKEKELIKQVEKRDDCVFVICVAEHNRDFMKDCLKDTVTIINYLRNKENVEYLEEWQIKSVEAMFKQCEEDKCIPYDLPGAIMAALGMWDELREALK